MRKGLVLVFMLIVFAGFASADVEDPKVYVKTDMDKKALVKFVNPSSLDIYDTVPIMEDYQGLSITDMPSYASEVDVRVYLKDRDTGEFKFDDGELLQGGPFSTSGDLKIDYREGVLRVEEFKEVTTTTVSGTTKDEKKIERVPVTGEVIFEEGVSYRSLVTVISLIVLIGVITFFVVSQRNKKLMAHMPEEKELEQLEKQAKSKGKAISKIREEQKLKAKIAFQKRKAAMKIAKEDAEISELNKEGSMERKRDAERFDTRSNKGGGFY